MVVLNLAGLLFYPIFVSFNVLSHPLAACYLMLSSTCLLLKLISFHHVMHDNRRILRKISYSKNQEGAEIQGGLPNDVYQEVLKYPRNL